MSGPGLLPLYLGFAATGVAVALPGAILPALLARWRLTDAQAGQLLLLAWLGSCLGALAVRGSLQTTLTLGSALAASGAAGLALTSRSAGAADASIFLYGLGLGLTMTTISLVRQATAPRSGTELVRLNLFWAAGACLCPSIASPALRTGDPRRVLCALALGFLLLGVWSALQTRLAEQPVTPRPLHLLTVLRRVPPALTLMVLLITGVEASAGGWLATYAHRGGGRLAEMVAAPTCLWGGLLLSRFVWSTWDRWTSPHAVVRASAGLMLASALLLLLRGSGATLLLAAFGLGAGIGPIYPLALDWTLRIERGGAIFFLAGIGSAALPWLTGAVSQSEHSLRSGLLVPLVGAAMIATLAWASPLTRWSTQTPLQSPIPTKPSS